MGDPPCIVRQPYELYQLVFGMGWLLHEIGRIAICARFFGERRFIPWVHARNDVSMSMCEHMIRYYCTRMDPLDTRVRSLNACQSAGRHMVCMACQPSYTNSSHYDIVRNAARQGVETLRDVRVHGVSLNARSEASHASVILTAALAADTHSVHNLLLLGVDCNARDIWGATAIMMAARISHLSITKRLVRAGADLGIQDAHGNTCLMISAEDPVGASVTSFLLSQGAAVDTRNVTGATALFHACSRGHHTNVVALLNAGACLVTTDMYGWSPLKHAVDAGNIANCTVLMSTLRDSGRTVYCKHTSALMVAIVKGFVDISRMLIAMGVPVDYTNADGRTALMVASRIGDVESVYALVAGGARLGHQDAAGNTALMYAAAAAHRTVARLLVEAGAPLDAQNRGGFTALMVSVDCADVVSLLLCAGADPDIRNNQGDTALTLASSLLEPSHPTAAVLREYADVDARNNLGSSYATGVPGLSNVYAQLV